MLRRAATAETSIPEGLDITLALHRAPKRDHVPLFLPETVKKMVPIVRGGLHAVLDYHRRQSADLLV